MFMVAMCYGDLISVYDFMTASCMTCVIFIPVLLASSYQFIIERKIEPRKRSIFFYVYTSGIGKVWAKISAAALLGFELSAFNQWCSLPLCHRGGYQRVVWPKDAIVWITYTAGHWFADFQRSVGVRTWIRVASGKDNGMKRSFFFCHNS